jgi:hypothetical protein
MSFFSRASWIPEFITAAQVEREGRATAFYRSVRAGAYRKVATGRYLPEVTWARLDADARYLALIYALGIDGRGAGIYSHLAAAALWRLPMVGQWPAHTEIIVPRGVGGASRVGTRAHSDGVPATLASIDGLRATTLARTVVDVARTQPLATAVAMADFSMRAPSYRDIGVRTARTTPADLADELRRHPSARGRRKAALALMLADGRSGSPGESLSRVGMHVLKVPEPILQHRFVDEIGEMFVDFWWPQFNLIGEFDGMGKYLREDMLNGKSTAQAVIDEKLREDRLRAFGPRVTRWGWSVAHSWPLLGAKLRSAGVK